MTQKSPEIRVFPDQDGEKESGENAEKTSKMTGEVPAGRIDKTAPTGKWRFDADVTDAFDDMLHRSIPDHDRMRDLCFSVGRRFVQPSTSVVDLGCSRGEALAPFVNRFGALNHFVGVEVSEPMLAAASERFAGYVSCGVAEIRKMDLRKEFPPVRASLILSILTMQFVPIEHRQRLFRDCHSHLIPGGAMILVEKVMGSSAASDAILAEEYWSIKEANGYSRDDIDRKRLALEGVLVPVTARWNEDMLAAAGFRQVECFWRVLNFAGWLAIKDC